MCCLILFKLLIWEFIDKGLEGLRRLAYHLNNAMSLCVFSIAECIYFNSFACKVFHVFSPVFTTVAITF